MAQGRSCSYTQVSLFIFLYQQKRFWTRIYISRHNQGTFETQGLETDAEFTAA